MRQVLIVVSCMCACVAGTATAAAQETITFEQALERARTRAPDVQAALARVLEARGRLTGASVRFRDNPIFDVDAGPRLGRDGDHSWDVSAAVGQTFETGGQRTARMASAQADVDHAVATADDAIRLIVRDVAVAYVTALGLQERVRLLEDAARFARELQTAAERRYAAGDIAALDLNLARITSTRANADVLRAQSELGMAVRPLRAALGLSRTAAVTLSGSLARGPASRDTLMTAVEQAPVLRAADAELRQAAADLRLAQAARRPDIGARVTAKREEGDRAIVGGLTVTWPAFNRGQELEATSTARARRIALERDAASQLVQLEIETGLESYRQRAEAARMLRDVALPAVSDNESLALRSFEAGELSLLDLLLVRQDATTTRLASIDALTEAALAAVDVDARAGVLR